MMRSTLVALLLAAAPAAADESLKTPTPAELLLRYGYYTLCTGPKDTASREWHADDAARHCRDAGFDQRATYVESFPCRPMGENPPRGRLWVWRCKPKSGAEPPGGPPA